MDIIRSLLDHDRLRVVYTKAEIIYEKSSIQSVKSVSHTLAHMHSSHNTNEILLSNVWGRRANGVVDYFHVDVHFIFGQRFHVRDYIRFRYSQSNID